MEAKAQELQHICGPCNKTFKHQSHLKPHVIPSHNQCYYHKCALCTCELKLPHKPEKHEPLDIKIPGQRKKVFNDLNDNRCKVEAPTEECLASHSATITVEVILSS